MTDALHGIFDSHAHYDDRRFDSDRDELLAALPGKGVACILNAACDLTSAAAGISMSERYEHIWCSAGIHPHEAASAPADYLARLCELLQMPKVRALGEIGLDYHYDFSPREIQLKVFSEQLELAGELGIPVIVHDREAHADTLSLLRRYRPSGVVHCFSGSPEMVREVIELGMYIGFTGVLTFKNAKKPLSALRAVPLERLLIETDAPYMAPEPFRGKRCDSSMLTYVAAVIARELELDTQTVIDITAQNAKRLLGV